MSDTNAQARGTPSWILGIVEKNFDIAESNHKRLRETVDKIIDSLDIINDKIRDIEMNLERLKGRETVARRYSDKVYVFFIALIPVIMGIVNHYWK